MNKPKCREFKVFPTSIGSIGIAWRPCGIVCLQLPEKTVALTKKALLQKIEIVHSDECLENHLDLLSIESSIQSYVSGNISHEEMIKHIPVDLSHLEEFEKRVYMALLRTKQSQTISYIDLARECDKPTASRYIGKLVSANPIPLVIPCHRVIYHNGNIGHFNAWQGSALKRDLLVLEKALLF